MDRPRTRLILAMSVDGKIADVKRSPARFGSTIDRHHLEQQIAQVDGVLLGAGTLRAYGSTLTLTQPALLAQRQQEGRSPQPTHIVCSGSGDLAPSWRFFQQPIPRWLMTTVSGAQPWQGQPAFEEILIVATSQQQINWSLAFQQLQARGFRSLAILGGGMMVASLLAAALIDELYLTVCPLLLGGRTAPTPVDRDGWLAANAPKLELLSSRVIGSEVFLHYRLAQ